MTAAIAIPVTTTSAAAALSGGAGPASSSDTEQTGGEDFAAALAALLSGKVAATQAHTHTSKAQLANQNRAAEETVDPNAAAAVLPVTPGLILTPAQKTAAQADPAAQINAQASQSSALQILQAATKATPEQPATASTAETAPAQATAPAAAFAALAANAQHSAQTAPATAKTPAKPAASKETGPAGKAQLDASANDATQAKESKTASSQLAGALQHALSNNANDNSQNGNTGSNQNASQPQAMTWQGAIAVHTAPVDMTAATIATAPTAQAQAAVPLDALAVNIARKFEGGENRFEIRLDPIELGKLEISMSVDHDGRVQAVVRAERPETLDMLQRDARLLENQLRQSGLNVDSNSLSFSLGNGNNQRSGFAGFGQAAASAFDVAEAETATLITTAVVNVRDGVDIRI